MCQGQVYGIPGVYLGTRIRRRRHQLTENAGIPTIGMPALCPPAVQGT